MKSCNGCGDCDVCHNTNCEEYLVCDICSEVIYDDYIDYDNNQYHCDCFMEKYVHRV